MTDTPPVKSYAPSVIALHWFMVLLLAAVFALMELRGIFPKGSVEREMMKSLHYSLGLAVLLLLVLRILLRFTTPAPAIVPVPPAWQTALSHAAHVALYGLMLAMPIIGWLALNADGKDAAFFGVTLPPLAAVGEEAKEFYEEVHEVLGTVFYIVIGLHAVAALAHHYLFKDNTLIRMLPRRT